MVRLVDDDAPELLEQLGLDLEAARERLDHPDDDGTLADQKIDALGALAVATLDQYIARAERQ